METSSYQLFSQSYQGKLVSDVHASYQKHVGMKDWGMSGLKSVL